MVALNAGNSVKIAKLIKQHLLFCLLVLASYFLSHEVHSAEKQVRIMSWGRDSSEKSEIGVNEIRMGCASGPESCAKSIDARNLSGVDEVALSLGYQKEDNFLEKDLPGYLKLVADHPKVKEIGMDDFASFMGRLWSGTAAQKMLDFIQAMKKSSAIRFRVTVYDDELAKISMNEKLFPLQLRKKVDSVAFYLRYRDNVNQYDYLLRQVTSLFPNAKIYGGVYHYDRIDYIFCDENKRERCTKEQEMELFSLTLKKQLQLVGDKRLAGLEFYPGFIGEESTWGAWKKNAICRQNRIEDCVKNSQLMGAILRDEVLRFSAQR